MAREDIAAVAARTLIEPQKHAGNIYSLAAEALSLEWKIQLQESRGLRGCWPLSSVSVNLHFELSRSLLRGL